MKISAHCNITDAVSQNYPYVESILSFAFFCDEVIVVDGGSKDETIAHLKKQVTAAGYDHKVRILELEWKREWVWTQFARSLNFGYDQCTGDIVIKFDADYIFDEKTVTSFLQTAHAWLDAKDIHPVPPVALTLHKVNLILAGKSFKKARVPLAINKRDYPEVRYGFAYREDPDFSAAIFPSREFEGIPIGESILERPELIRDTPGTIWVYDFTFMDRPTVEGIVQRAARARMRLNEAMPDEQREKIVNDLAMGSVRKFMRTRAEGYHFQEAPPAKHPEIIREKLLALKPEMFGASAFGWLDDIKLKLE